MRITSFSVPNGGKVQLTESGGEAGEAKSPRSGPWELPVPFPGLLGPINIDPRAAARVRKAIAWRLEY